MKKEDKEMLITLAVFGGFILAGGAIFGIPTAVTTKSVGKTICAFGGGTVLSALSLAVAVVRAKD